MRRRPDLPHLPGHQPVPRLRHQLARLRQLHRDLGPLTTTTTGPLLVEDPSIAEYYLPACHTWQRWSSTRNIVLPTGASTAHPTKAAGVTGDGDPATFAHYITRHYFTLIALNFADTTTLDHQIRADLRHAGYTITQVVPYGTHGTYVIYRHGPPQ